MAMASAGTMDQGKELMTALSLVTEIVTASDLSSGSALEALMSAGSASTMAQGKE